MIVKKKGLKKMAFGVALVGDRHRALRRTGGERLSIHKKKKESEKKKNTED